MSTEIKKKTDIVDDFSTTRYYGGKGVGVCYQLTGDNGYVRLTERDIYILHKAVIIYKIYRLRNKILSKFFDGYPT